MSVKNVSITGKVCFQRSIYEKLCKVTRTKLQATCRRKYISLELIMFPVRVSVHVCVNLFEIHLLVFTPFNNSSGMKLIITLKTT